MELQNMQVTPDRNHILEFGNLKWAQHKFLHFVVFIRQKNWSKMQELCEKLKTFFFQDL